MRTQTRILSACPLTLATLPPILATATIPRKGRGGQPEMLAQARARGIVDVAIIMTMRDAQLLRAEAERLSWDDVELDLDARVGRLHLPGVLDPLFIGPYAVDSLAHLRPVEPDRRDPVFGLSASQIHRRIQAAARAGGLEGHYTGDSPRAGMRLDLIAAGVRSVQEFYSI